MLYKILYDIIGSYSNVANLNDFMEKEESIKHICDSCNKNFEDITDKNNMIYEMVCFNNNTIGKLKEFYGSTTLLEYMNLSNIKIKKSKYNEISKIYCDNCCKRHNKCVKKLQYFDITNEPLQISTYHLNFIKQNKNLFVKDYLKKKIVMINRYKYQIKEDELIIDSLSINKKQSLKMVIENPKFEILYKIIKDDFSLNITKEDLESY